MKERVTAPADPQILGRTERAGQTTDAGKGRIFPCDGCGADLVFHIGKQLLRCPFCGFEKAIDLDLNAVIQEQNLLAMLEHVRELRDDGERLQPGDQEVRCESCGGTVLFSGTLSSTSCPYCDSPIQRENIHTVTTRIPADAVLPFLVDDVKARTLLGNWVKSRWFAPNEFIRRGVEGKFTGVYFPFWTFDSMTFSRYQGQRGDNYVVTVRVGNKTQTQIHVRWTSASGAFQRFFDDVLILASQDLPQKLVHGLEPWPLGKAIPFTQQVLAGFLASTYDVELEAGFKLSRQLMERAIEAEVRQRIGGDHQRVDHIDSRFDALTYKHILLPLWLLAYKYRGQVYQVLVNGASGTISGERPYSVIKIILFILMILAIVGGFAAFQSAHQ